MDKLERDSMENQAVDRLAAMSRVIKKEHAGQSRHAGRVPYWHHCERVSEVLKKVLETTGEADQDTLACVLIAAKGHDLYEDTQVDPRLIAQEFGDRVDSLIRSLTNEKGDSDRSDYLKKIKTSCEEARLIKLADLYDNFVDGKAGISTMGLNWARDFLEPILEEMWENIRQTEFVAYKKSGEKLFAKIESARSEFLEELRK